MEKIKTNNYNVYFNENSYEFLNKILTKSDYSKLFILVDSNSHEKCLPLFLSNLETDIPFEIIEIEPGEHFKNIQTCVQLWEILIDLGADRKSILINVGGGVITDIGGFIASTFKRGIAFVNVPTTLLAMVDASIGGKNGVDLGTLKNQIGCITEPLTVLINTTFLECLPQNQMRSGLAEMLKHGLIADKKYWDKFKNLKELNASHLNDLIRESIVIKSNIVAEDLTENGIRKALNFGHTLGHAIESYCLENENIPELLHGEAIAIGMILESFISLELNLITKEEYAEIKYIITDIFEKVVFTQEDINKINELLIFDKKNEFGKIQFALLDGIGKIKINQIVDKSIILNAFNDYLNN